jgi:hypothetical protein
VLAFKVPKGREVKAPSNVGVSNVLVIGVNHLAAFIRPIGAAIPPSELISV